MPDRDLVQASLRGDIRAFACLVERYRYAVFGLCLNHTRDFDAAEEAVQEAFIKAFLKLRNLADGERFAPWLRQIAVNESRMGHRHRRESLSEALEERLVSSATPHEEVVAKETCRQVLAALGRLSSDQQQVITLFYLEGFSLKRIAAFLDLPPQTVNQRLYRARNQLRKETLTMVEETLGKQKLPEGFTEEVIKNALQRGRQLLQEQRWTEAKTEFRKVTGTIGEHLDAQRGLALALEGEVDVMMSGRVEDIDEKLLQEALAAHQEAFRLGAQDEETAWNLAGLYDILNRLGDRAEVLRVFGESTDDPEKAWRALEQASWGYRHIDNQLAFDLHRKALALEGIAAQERLRSYCGARVTIYLALERGDQWLGEVETLLAEVGLPITEAHRLCYRDQMSLLRRMGREQEAIATGQAFLRLAEPEAVDDPIQRRWWISEVWERLIRLYHATENEKAVEDALIAARDNLLVYEEEWHAAVAAVSDAQKAEELEIDYRKFNSYANGNLAHQLRLVGRYDESIEWTERALRFREHGSGYMGLAWSHLGKNDRDAALAAVKRMHRTSSESLKKWVHFGGAKRWFENEVFDSVRRDPEFLELLEVTGS